MDRTMRLDVSGNRVIVRLLRAGSLLTAAVGLMLSGCSPGVNATRECYYTSKSMQHSLPACETFNLNVYTKDGNRLDIYFQIPFSHLHFEKDIDLFKASYTASFILRDDNGSIVRANDVDRTVIAQSYTESISSLHDAFLKMFYVPPGDYMLEIIVTDNWSRMVSRRRQKVEVESLSREDFCASDYLLFEYARREQQGISLKPIFPSGLSYVKDSIGIFQELYNVLRGDTVGLSLSYSLTIPHDTVDTKFVSIAPPYNVRLSYCMRDPDSTYYRSDSAFVSPVDGVLQVFQNFPKLNVGVTMVTRKVFLHRNGTVDSSVSTARYTVYSSSFPHINGVDEEIAAVGCIGLPREIDSIRAGATLSDRLHRLLLFWEDHGGSMRRKELYNRVEEANELFSSCTEGWKTPMGISYIVCGTSGLCRVPGPHERSLVLRHRGQSQFCDPISAKL